MNYGKGVRLARAVSGLSQKGLAARAQVDASYISMIERQLRSPSVTTLETIASALRVPLYVLILLSSEQGDLRGVAEKDAEAIGRDLLSTLVRAQRSRKK